MKPELAKSISEDLLSRSGNALMTGDFAAFLSCFCFPHEVETVQGIERLAGPADLKAIFENVRRQFRRRGVNRIERNILEATFRGDDVISCTHQSRLLNGTNLIQRPYPVFTLLKRINDQEWQIKSGIYGLTNEPDNENAITADILNLPDALD